MAWTVALPLFACLAAVSISAAFLADRTIITGSIARTHQLPASGSILQAGQVVGIANGAKLTRSTIEFAEIRGAKKLDFSREFTFSSYQLGISRIRVVRYAYGDPDSGVDLEHVVAHIRSHSNNQDQPATTQPDAPRP
jgi:hypothetical protein